MTTNEFTTADGKYAISSYGNGWAFEVEELSTGESVFFQDHDAQQLQTDTNNFENTDVIGEYFECLEG